jgi:peptide-methionine (S)-S-oxide reductase
MRKLTLALVALSGIGIMIAVFYHNEGQRVVAEKQRARQAAKQGVPLEEVQTSVIPVKTFTYAEDYHQKYLLTRHSKLRTFLEQTYPSARELADSSVATRLNAFLGWGLERDIRVLEREIDSYGLPADLAKDVLAKARKR